METHLADFVRDSAEGREADAILRKCVHCGFCTATCPTYQLLGDELDGPRGRIYLIKEFLEGATPTRRTQLHLDRCLTCRNCETTCPSGVEYGHLVDIGRNLIAREIGHRRPIGERVLRWALREGLTRAWLFGSAYRVGQAVRGLLPRSLAAKIGPRVVRQPTPTRRHGRRMVIAEGCVQPALSPQINDATRRVLDALGIEVQTSRGERCCGALRSHLDDGQRALDEMRANVDAWCAQLDSGAEAIISTASGCGVMIKDYGHLLANDARYRERAERVADATRDIGEVLFAEREQLTTLIALSGAQRVAYHAPCTLQHGQKLPGQVEAVLRAAGVEVATCRDAHLCCGSAGTYSILQAPLAAQLRTDKLARLEETGAEVFVSANIGCLMHLAAGTERPVRHWIEIVDERLSVAGRTAS
jgi:glycolate oxidase iron-sulfur subunit